MAGFVRVLVLLIVTIFAFVAADCVDDCYLASIPQSNRRPGSADPNAPATPAYLQCICPTCNLKTYLACVNANCNAPGVSNFFNNQCAASGGVGSQCSQPSGLPGRRRWTPRKPNGQSIAELQARVPHADRLMERDNIRLVTGELVPN
ncbi:hypothetical protein BKA62DRAFT_718147, partial [Auriculariales sp. MPI-PUGE-AT-0066]